MNKYQTMLNNNLYIRTGTSNLTTFSSTVLQFLADAMQGLWHREET